MWCRAKLALLLRHKLGNAAVTADCKPAIAQAECATYRASHTNIWDDVWEERHRLQITWHPSHRSINNDMGTPGTGEFA